MDTKKHNPKISKSLRLKQVQKISPSQWINGDIRQFDFSILGKVDVIMADPPWDIHMNLPYGTLKDFEMR